MFLETIIWILVNFGIANGLVHSKLFSFLREGKGLLPDLFRCVMCVGFWSGLGLSVWRSPTGFIIYDGFFGSATAWLLYLLVMNRQAKT